MARSRTKANAKQAASRAEVEKNRARALAEAEKATGCTYEVPFFVYKGITMCPMGYEAPYVEINGQVWELADLEVLRQAVDQARRWAEEGWCPGMC